MGEWLEIDGARTGAPDGLTIDAEGISVVARGRETRASWEDVLGVARVGGTVYALVPRRAPDPPWIAIDAGDRDPDELASELRTRSEQAGYRQARVDRAVLSPRALLRRVHARQDVPGAVEVPAAFAAPRPRHEGIFAMGGAGGGAAIGLALTIQLQVPTGLIVLGTVVAGMLAGVRVARAIARPGPRPRLMVLSPDGIVASLDGEIRALRWDRIRRVERAIEADAAGDVEERVRVVTTNGKKHRLDSRWIDAPTDLVVAIAETYRKRWSAARDREEE